jgi:hypothetical protein
MERKYKHLNNPANARRKAAIEDIIATKGKSVGESMRKAGYGPGYAHNPQDFLKCAKTQQFIDWVNYELEQVQDGMERTRNKAKYKELADTCVNLMKIKMLLGGQATERIVISEEEKAEVDSVLNNN